MLSIKHMQSCFVGLELYENRTEAVAVWFGASLIHEAVEEANKVRRGQGGAPVLRGSL